MRRRPTFGLIFTYLGLLLAAIFVLLPIWNLMRNALDGALYGAPTHFQLAPEEWSIQPFIDVWRNPSQALGILGLLKNTILVSGGAALIAVGFGAGMAYAFARFRFPGRELGLFSLLLGTLLPPVALMTPLFVLLTILGIRTTLFGLMIVYTAFSMPFCVWNMRSSFQAVPVEIEEAALLDGASHFQTFRHVTLPMALPSIGVAALIAFLLGYTEFALGWLFVENARNVTLAMTVSGYWSQAAASWNRLSALAIMMSIPVVLIFLLLNRMLSRGWLLGMTEE